MHPNGEILQLWTIIGDNVLVFYKSNVRMRVSFLPLTNFNSLQKLELVV